MSWEDYSEYYEPSEYDIVANEFAEKMKDLLKIEVKTYYENIKVENANLKSENEKLKDEVRKIDDVKRDLEIKKKNLIWEVRKERLSTLMKDFEIIMYQADHTYIELPKCNKCDENRKIKFISPLGKEMSEPCECATRKSIYIIKEYICSEFKIDNQNINKLSAWYKIHEEKDYDYYEHTDYCKTIYNDDMEYKDLNHYTYFKSKKECQKYCDWLNKKELK